MRDGLDSAYCQSLVSTFHLGEPPAGPRATVTTAVCVSVCLRHCVPVCGRCVGTALSVSSSECPEGSAVHVCCCEECCCQLRVSCVHAGVRGHPIPTQSQHVQHAPEAHLGQQARNCSVGVAVRGSVQHWILAAVPKEAGSGSSELLIYGRDGQGRQAGVGVRVVVDRVPLCNLQPASQPRQVQVRGTWSVRMWSGKGGEDKLVPCGGGEGTETQ